MDKSSVQGLEEFRASLAQGIQRQREALKMQLERLGVQMTIEIKAAAPVKSGATQHSVRYVVLDTKNGERLDIKVGDEVAYYVEHIELGTAHAPAQPFVRPVVYRYEKLVPAQISEGVQKAWS